MSTQIAVRLDDEALAVLDAEVDAGRADSRSDALRHAIAHVKRQQAYRRDEEILAKLRAAGVGVYPDLDKLATMTVPDID